MTALPAKFIHSPRRRVMPGFGLALGFAVSYLSLVVLIPLSALFFKSMSLGPRTLLGPGDQ